MAFRFETAQDRLDNWHREMFRQKGDDPNNPTHNLLNDLYRISLEIKAAQQRGADTSELFAKEQEIVNKLEERGWFDDATM